MKTCTYCDRTLSGDICSVHGFVGAPKKDGGDSFPKGGIIMWAGAVAAIPTGWALCDGTNGTPNLRDKFVIGAGSTYAVAATGGSNAAHSHTVAVTVDATGIWTGPLSHDYLYNQVTDLTQGGALAAMFSLPDHEQQDLSHGHTASGSSGTGSSMPAYYALAYIMKL
jgi:hypothetical protein